MDIVPYEDIKITTMTLIMSLTSSVNTQSAFQLLPITRVEVVKNRISSKM